MKVHFNITSDTLTMKFHRPNQSIKLEGFILGYGSNYFTNQYIQWPDNGKPFITDVEAEARYLIAVKPNENPKTCKEKNSSQKPLQIVIGTLTPTSVFLSWGILINPQIDWSALSKCPNDRFYTVRYREKSKDWNFQLCPTTETVIDNLKPNTLYEFGVKDNSDEIWGKPQNHKTSPKGKENGNIDNTYKIPKGTLQYATEDTKTLIPVIVVKQGFQNITKSTAAPPSTVQSPVFREETKKPSLTTTRPPTPKPKPVLVQESYGIPFEDPEITTMDSLPSLKPPRVILAPTKTKVSESEVLSSTEERHTKLALPTIAPVSFTKELPVVQPETVLASDQLATYMPEPMTVSHIIPDQEPASTEAPQLQSSTVSSDLLPEQHRTLEDKGDVPESVDVPQVSTDIPIKLRTTSGMHPISALVPKLSTYLPIQKHTTTMAAKMKQPIYGSTTKFSLEKAQTYHATSSQSIPVKQSTLPSQTHKKTTSASVGSSKIITTQQSIVMTTVQHPIPVPTEMLSFHPKPSTEAPDSEADSTLPEFEIITTDAPHMYEPEKTTLASDDHTIVQKRISTSESHTIAYRTTTTPFTTNTPTTSQRIQSTLASKRERVSPAQPKNPMSKKTQPTTVPAKTQKIPDKKDQLTVGPIPQIDLKTFHLFPTDILESDIFDHPKIQLGKTEKDVSSKSQSPSTTAVPKPAKMPINLIRVHIYEDPALPSVQSEIQTTTPPTPKTVQSNKIPQSKPAPKTTKKVPIHVISLQIFDEPDEPMVSNTTLTPSQSTTTQRLERPHTIPVTVQKVSQPITQKPKPTPRTRTKPVSNTTLTPSQSTTTQRSESPSTTPVPVQKVSQPITQKPKPTPRTRTKPAPTAAPKETTTLPKILHVTAAATLATYKVQHSSTRPRTSLRPRTRPAQNGTTQGSSRPRPTGDFSWAPGTIPGGRVLDNTKLLGVSRNISMEPNNTRKRTFSVSSPPLPPVKPTVTRRRNHYSNVTGRPGVTVSSPPLPPVKPTTIRRKPPTNGTAKPAPTGDILIPRAPSSPKHNCTVVYIKPPKVQPTLPATDEDFVDPTVFNPSPKSDLDALGKPRYTAPHVKYIDKEDNVPCSITESLKHFPSEESTIQDISTPPQNPPSNLTIVTVEGCPSFVILDWDVPNNDSATEYKVISTENGAPDGKNQSIITTNQTYSTVENLKPDTKYDFKVVPTNPLGEGPVSTTVEFNTESADPRVSEPVTGGKDAIWTEIKFKSDSYSECKGKQYVKRTWYKKFVGIQLCNSLRYKIYLSNSLTGTFYNIGDQSGYGEDHCQFVDSFLDGRTGQQLLPEQLTTRTGFYRSVRQQPVEFGDIGGRTHIGYVHWYECGIAIPGKW
ncbi:target of Nesh-SH3 isoform 3-T3 [Mantella aurantiaca]